MQPDSSRHPSPPSSRSARALAGSAVHLEIAARTHTGWHRDNNEDSYLVTGLGAAGPFREARQLGDSVPGLAGSVDLVGWGWAAMAVCDGMGGAAAGEVASAAAVEIIDDVLRRGGQVSGRDDLGWRLIASIEEASRRIFGMAVADPKLSGMGTTATVCALHRQDLFIAQVGDSRAYLLRRGRLTQLTRDQTLIALLRERGQVDPEAEAELDLGHVILQAVGTTADIDVELTHVTVRRGDVLLVCSDGLHGPVSDDMIRAVLENEPSPAAASEQLIDFANEAGGPDNVTCIVARIDGDALSSRGDPVTPEKAHLSDVTRDAQSAPASTRSQRADAAPDLGSMHTAFMRMAGIFRR